MKTILAIDSTTEVLSASVSENGNIVSELEDNKSQRHMVNIINDIDTVLKHANKTVKDIDLFSINLGPGDFTGGRIGISVVKMFSMLSGKPVFGFNSLDVFSTGCVLKNINSISKKMIDLGGVYIMPLMDVRNDEIYFSIYEVKNYADSNNLIFRFDFEGKQYYLYKRFGDFLLGRDDFSKKFSQIINQLNLLKKCNCLTCSQIFNNGNSSEDTGQGKEQNHDFTVLQKEFLLILTANAVKSHKELFENLIRDIKSENKGVSMSLDEKNVNPNSKYLNFLADYSFSNGLKSLPIAPVYVRDFIAFK
ncbi:MAG: tRNA (adenosine(37)-N6)-threonylcarbamoyltransferase complex dimerization subunit type 1 TsaB [Actinobacteria bacterium]|nr:tRNA (adenosine(37)-N6)-threonylcarbamoyltransferase complex dimerization subunit type 1 TsaB [Actinomycetota bacterium]